MNPILVYGLCYLSNPPAGLVLAAGAFLAYLIQARHSGFSRPTGEAVALRVASALTSLVMHAICRVHAKGGVPNNLGAVALGTILFYGLHRALHVVPCLRTHIHNWHHQSLSVSMRDSLVMHPLEMALQLLAVLYVPAWLCGMDQRSLNAYGMTASYCFFLSHSASVGGDYHRGHHRNPQTNLGINSWLWRRK